MPWPWERCKHAINYDGLNIAFSGLEGPEEVNFKVSKFQIKKDLLQAACEIAQMYDLFAYRNCQRIQEFPKNDPQRTSFILEITKNEERLIEFLAILRIATAHPSEQIEKALSDWVAFTFTKRIYVESPIIPQKMRGEQAREPPPIEALNRIKRSIAKARTSSNYFKIALQNPQFDINKVYQLSCDN